MDAPKVEFNKYPKIPRFRRDWVITEKVDGTNALVYVDAEGGVFAASRNRWLTTEEDNYGFAAWVESNSQQLKEELGCGFHRGEWAGKGIQRGYGMSERVFVLFDVKRYSRKDLTVSSMVPVLEEGARAYESIDKVLNDLRDNGSYFSVGYSNPEGVVICHTLSGHLYKIALDGDDKPKGRII